MDATTGTGRDVRRQNAAAVMRTVLSHGPLSRAEIARRTKLTSGAITKITSVLVDVGALREGAPHAAREMGRPVTPLDLDLQGRAVIGLHIGLLWTAVGVVDLRGTVLGQLVVTHDRLDPDSIIRQAREAVTKVVRRHASGRELLGVGSSIGGWVEPELGIVVEHPSLGWRQVALASRLREELGLRVLVDNSVCATALAEMWYGSAKGVRSLVELFVGNIVGAALTVEGRMHRGPSWAAGQLTHFPVQAARGRPCTCGRKRCFQALGSDVGVVEQARERSLIGPGENLDAVIGLARGGNTEAGRLLRGRARLAGQVVAVILDLIDPERVVLAGGILDAPEYVPDVVAEATRRSHTATRVADRVIPSGLGEVSRVLASAGLFLDAYFADPLAFESNR